MTQEQYYKSIATNELQLDSKFKPNYFFSVYFFLFISVFCLLLNLWNFLRNQPAYFIGYKLLIILIPIVLGIIIYLLQKKRLKFHIVKTTLTDDEITASLEQLIKKEQWFLYFVAQNIYIIKTKSLVNNWGGERITILIKGHTVFINSIGDPDPRQSFFSLLRNADHVKSVLTNL